MYRTGYWRAWEFVVKQPLGAHERRGVVSFVSQQPRSLPSNQPSTRDGKGPRGLLLRPDARSSGRAGVEKDSLGHFCPYCAKPRTGKCCQRPSHQRSERLNVCHRDHATLASTCLVGSYFYCSTLLCSPTLVPLRLLVCVCVCVCTSHRRAVLTILRLARLCLVYGRLSSSVDPKDAHVCKLSQRA